MKIIGHRGALGLAPEHTTASFEAAMQYGVDEIEFDVRVTADGVPVLHHNSFLAGDNGGRMFIGRNTYAKLKDFRADLMTLDEVFAITKGTFPLYIEVKPGVATKPIASILTQQLAAGADPNILSIASYSQRTLQALHAELPELPTIVIENWSALRATWRARRLGTKRISMNQRWLWSGFIRAMSRRGWQLTTFTINDPAKARAWQECGLQGVVTNYPDRFAA